MTEIPVSERMTRKIVRVAPFIERRKDAWLVGSKYLSDDSLGPVAQIYHDKSWLYISTDDTAMLAIETLPLLRRVLNQMAKEIRAMHQAHLDEQAEARA